MPRFLRSILVEIPLTTTAAGSTINFADVPQLRGKFVQGIETFTNAQITKTPTQRNVIGNLNGANFLVNLLTDSETTFEYIPYFTLIPASNGGIIREFKNLKININKSNIYITSPSGLTVNESAVFNFYYTDKEI
jgi:hypothetical protein